MTLPNIHSRNFNFFIIHPLTTRRKLCPERFIIRFVITHNETRQKCFVTKKKKQNKMKEKRRQSNVTFADDPVRCCPAKEKIRVALEET